MEGIDYPSENDDRKKFEKNNQTNALNVLYAKKNYISLLCFKTTQTMKNNFFLMIPNGEGWHYIPVKKLFVLLREITKHDGDFYSWNCH